MTHPNRQTVAALATLVTLQLIMLTALYADIAPHPPQATKVFGMAPFLGASVCLALSAIILQPLATVPGRVVSVLATLAALVSFGPQKYLDAQFGLIWPAVILGQVAALVIVGQIIAQALGRSSDANADVDAGALQAAADR